MRLWLKDNVKYWVKDAANYWLIDDLVDIGRAPGWRKLRAAIIVFCLFCLIGLGVAVALQMANEDLARRRHRARRKQDAIEFMQRFHHNGYPGEKVLGVCGVHNFNMAVLN